MGARRVATALPEALSAPLVLLLAGLLGAPLVGCSEATPESLARRVDTRTDLIGGPSALGEVGDFLLENDYIRVIVQDKGFSRGFGVYGGGLIDIDRQMATAPGDTEGGNGRDQFGELFPIAFLQALEPDTVEVVADGSDGGTAIVRVAGTGADFISLTKALNQAVLNSHELPPGLLDILDTDNLVGEPQIGYEVFYELAPEARHVRIRVRLTNLTEEPLAIPSNPARTILSVLAPTIDVDTFDAPLGFVLLFGAGNKVFSPGFGYDIRFSLDDIGVGAGAGLPFPALPGLLTNGLFTTSDDISYGFFALPDAPGEEPVLNFAANRVDGEGDNLYEEALGVDVEQDTMLVPFLASSFTGVFYAQTPRELPAGGSTEFSAYMAVGNGDVGSVMDTVLALRAERGDPQPLVELFGQVEDAQSTEALEGLSVVIYRDGVPVNQYSTDAFGRFRGTMPAGQYTARVERDPVVSDHVPFELGEADGARFVRLAAPTPAWLTVRVRDDVGSPLPAKVTVVGTAPADVGGAPYRNTLFDVQVGQHWRTHDTIEDDPDDPMTRRYIETVEYTDAAGKVRLPIPPGVQFEVYISRGIEYSLSRTRVTGRAGEATSVVAQLERVVDTTGWISADFHLHAAPSLDSALDLGDRVRSVVGEGVEILTATDHNFITDYGPTLLEEGLEDWATSMIGLELTTLESGHFNGFPLVRDVGRITKGAFEWSLRPPDELFEELRALGRFGPDDTIVQVNHPRDTILGYFEQYDINALDGSINEGLCGFANLGDCLAPNGPAFRGEDGMSTFSDDFDAIEVLNGSVVDQLYHLRVPADVRGLQIPELLRDNLPPPGTILCDATVDDEAGTIEFGTDVAFPGALDDWFNLLNRGHRAVGTGTSDSHDADDHTGYARSFLKVDDDRPRAMTDRVIVDAFKSGNLLMTNGPFVEVEIAGGAMGGEVDVDTDEGATVNIQVQAAEWIDVDRGRIWVNGEVVETFAVQLVERRFEHRTTVPLARDSWVVVEVTGDGSMFPIVRPVDIPPLQLGTAFGAIAEPLGLGGSSFGALEPDLVGVFTPVAITNPVFVRVPGSDDKDGVWDAPGPLVRCCDGDSLGVRVGEKACPPGPEKRALPIISDLPRSFGFPRVKGDIEDVRAIFEQFGRHQH